MVRRGPRVPPYHFLYLLPLLLAAGVYRPTRVAGVVATICVLLWAPALYQPIDFDLAVAIATEMVMFALVGDINYFKRVNDIAGHLAGDEFLKKVGRSIKRVKRDAAESFRWAGDEFAVLMPGSDVDGARDLGERINDEVAKIETPDDLDRLAFTFGYADFDPEEDESTDFLRVADSILVKKKGERPRRP